MKVGLWAVGALGNVSTCTALGLAAFKRKLSPTTGLLTELPEFQKIDFCAIKDIVFGGHDIRTSDLYKEAIDFSRKNNVPTLDLIERLKPDLKKSSGDIKKGFTLNSSRSLEKFNKTILPKDKLELKALIKSIQKDLINFKQSNSLDDVIVINLASTENGLKREFKSLDQLEDAIRKNKKADLLSSMIYAYASLSLGFPYINFTASIGSSLEPFDELAKKHSTCHMGKDAKTGETLLKTAIAPMFYYRNLHILSWEAHNILGNNDGYVLSFKENKEPKLRDKNGVLHDILGYKPASNVRIDYVESLGDHKTAWDYVHFQGFLNSKMTLQIVWQGIDSILAAPLVIDLVRLAEYTHRMGFTGTMKHLAVFFKAPFSVNEHNLVHQFNMLKDFFNVKKEI